MASVSPPHNSNSARSGAGGTPWAGRRFLAPVAMYCCLATAALYKVIGSPAGAPALAFLIATCLLASSIASWIGADARRRQCSLPYDFDSLVFFGWWVVAPAYLFCSRGWRGFIPLFWFLLIYLAAGLTASVPYFLHRAQ